MMNERRQRQGVAPITTMREGEEGTAKSSRLEIARGTACRFAAFPGGRPVGKNRVFGAQVTRFNPKANSISVCLADGKKAHRFFVDRLLQEAADLGVNLAAKIVPPPVPKSTASHSATWCQ